MKIVRLTLLLAIVCGALALPAQAQDHASSARARLVEQIRNAETLHRDDLLADAVARLRRIHPDAPEALVAQVYLATRRNDMTRARELLDRLERIAPGSAFHRQAQALLRLSSEQAQATLAQARLYAAVGRLAEARQAYDDAFQGVYPTADLSLEYWQLRARRPEDRAVAITKLHDLLKQYPRHPGLLLALANHSFSNEHPTQALAYVHRLAEIPGQLETAATREYEYLSAQPVGAESARALADFVQRHTGTSVHDQAQALLAGQSRLLDDPAWRNGRSAVARVDAGAGSDVLATLKRAVKGYPDDAEFLGALGLAYSRANDRPAALSYFKLAREKEPRIDQASRWVSLITSTEYWILLQRAANAADQQQWVEAQALYGKAHRQDPANIFAFVGLADTAFALGQRDKAWGYYLNAFRLAPADSAGQRGIERYLASVSPDEALRRLDRLPPRLQTHLAGVRLTITLAHLQAQAEQAQAEGRWDDAVKLLTQSQSLNPDDPWISYSLAVAVRATGSSEQALRGYRKHLDRHPESPTSQYVYALLLESADAWQEARSALKTINRSQWTPDMAALDDRLRTRQRIVQAGILYDQGQTQAAIAKLEQPPQNTATRLQVAEWTLRSGNHAKALAGYRTVLRTEPDNLDARLGELETRMAEGRTDLVRKALEVRPVVLRTEDISGKRRLALLWAELGETGRARVLLQQAVASANPPEPLLFRDYARVTAASEPTKALDLYAKGMVAAGMLAEGADEPRVNALFTEAMLTPDLPDDWLRQSLRNDAEALYQRTNLSVTLSNDTWVRNDGTPGVSRLNANTTMLQLDYPVLQGKGFVRADHIRLNAGEFGTSPAGEIEERFGTCVFAGLDAQGEAQALPGCRNVRAQRTQGTAFALGWQGDAFGFDIGHTPPGFKVSNWTAGLNIQGDLGDVGWRLAMSRRAMANSLLSLAGATDPRTGVVWGGVMATGATLNLSWDKGETHGVWFSLGHHKLTGKNVANNHRTRLMGGYYHRLINKPNEQLSVGINAMHWRYDRDLGNYTLGQGGYYSPQRYSSMSLPVSYARRTANWSFSLAGSVSRSVATSHDESYYPLLGMLSGPLGAMQNMGVSAAGMQAVNISTGSTSGAWGYTVRGAAEHRLSNHWVAGAAFDLQHGQDYAPSRFMLYLRYTFEPWRGNLQLRPTGLTPYVDFD